MADKSQSRPKTESEQDSVMLVLQSMVDKGRYNSLCGQFCIMISCLMLTSNILVNAYVIYMLNSQHPGYQLYSSA